MRGTLCSYETMLLLKGTSSGSAHHHFGSQGQGEIHTHVRSYLNTTSHLLLDMIIIIKMMTTVTRTVWWLLSIPTSSEEGNDEKIIIIRIQSWRRARPGQLVVVNMIKPWLWTWCHIHPLFIYLCCHIDGLICSSRNPFTMILKWAIF